MPIKVFEPIHFDHVACQTELAAFRQLLDTSLDLKESQDILPFFRAKRNLSALLGSYHGRNQKYDRLAWEYDLFGDFSCDLAVGDSTVKGYCFIEFEDAGPRSLFVKQGEKATREWSTRFDHGFSQIIDWFYKLNDRRNSDDLEARFGKRSVDYTGVLVIGRNQYLDAGEVLRWEWRREHVIVNSKRIVCVTYDELYQDLITAISRNVPAAPGPP